MPSARLALASLTAVGVALGTALSASSVPVESTTTSALAATAVATPAPAALSDDDRAEQSVAWLLAQRDPDGTMPGPGTPQDWGLTLDVLFALHATGTGQGAAEEIITVVEDNVGAYAGPGWWPDEETRLAGPTAKVLVAAVVAGEDHTSFGGRDMRAETLALIRDEPGDPEHGRIKDHIVGYPGTDDSNTFSQSLAVIGLARTGSVPEEAVDFLARQQCSEGYFRMFANDRGTNPELTCDGGKANGLSGADTDGTAMGLQALMSARDQGFSGLDDEINSGLDYLVGAQREDGSFGGGVSTEGSNTNSTALAAVALDAGGRDAAAQEAIAYVRGLHVDPDTASGTPMSGDIGAIAYNQSSFDEALANGIGISGDQWRRASAQAVLAFAPVPLGQIGDDNLDPDPAPPPAPTDPPEPTDPEPTDPGPSDPGPSDPSDPTDPSAPGPSDPPTSGPAPTTAPSPTTPPGGTAPPGSSGGSGTGGGSGGGSGGDSTGGSGVDPLPSRPGAGSSGVPGAGVPAGPGDGSAPGADTDLQTATAGPGEGPAADAIAYLTAQLVDGTHLRTEVDGTAYVDHAETARAALAMIAAGAPAEQVQPVVDHLLDPQAVAEHAHGAPYDAEDAAYPEPLANLVLLAEFTGADPRSVGDTDLVAELVATQERDGWFRDDTDLEDTTDTESQARAVLALTAAGETEAAGLGAERLVDLQCDDGLFPAADPGDEGCVDGDPGSTGVVLQALNAVPADEATGDEGQATRAGDEAQATSAAGDEADATAGPQEETPLTSAAGSLLQAREGGVSWAGDTVPLVPTTGGAASGLIGGAVPVDASVGWLVEQRTPEGALPADPGGETDRGATISALPALAHSSFLTVPGGPLAPSGPIHPGEAPEVEVADDAAVTSAPAPQAAPAAVPEEQSGSWAWWLLLLVPVLGAGGYLVHRRRSEEAAGTDGSDADLTRPGGDA